MAKAKAHSIHSSKTILEGGRMKQNVMINVILHFCPLGRSIKEWQDKVTAEPPSCGIKQAPKFSVYTIKTMQVDLLRSGA